MTRDEMIDKLVDLQREIGSTANGAHCYGVWARRISEVIAALRAPAVTGEAAQHAQRLREMAERIAHVIRMKAHAPTGQVADGDVMLAASRAACLAGADALAAPPAAGAPPALVALHAQWRDAYVYSRTALAGSADEERELAARLALLAWSPAPAPVAPPAEKPCSVCGRLNRWGDCCTTGVVATPPAETYAICGGPASSRRPTKPCQQCAPAPPAVAGGDAPEDGPRCTCPVRPCGACDYDPPRQLRSVNDGPYLKGQAPRRRRQEGQ